MDGEQSVVILIKFLLAWTENKRGRRASVDGEQAWTENKRGYFNSTNSLVCTTGMDLNKCGLEQSVDLNKLWT